ncbi:MAG: RNA polymerase subunit sigma-24 [Planctomycetaceae bacterium]|nr:RNA polymerase subunit sigma-24 [Planctomycetaceae bacterium]
MTSTPPTSDRRRFATTRWSVVLAAGSADADDALSTLCETYWYPLYAYVRRQGRSAEDAQDLTQGFFTRLLEKHDLKTVRPELGRFRSFLLASLKHFLINDWDRRHAHKRGSGRIPLSLDFDSAEQRYRLEPATEITPEDLFEKQWALTLIARVETQLADDAQTAGQSAQFQRLRIYITGQKTAGGYARASQELDMTEDALKQAVHRLRKKFAERLRREIAETAEEIDDEIRDLFNALTR